MIKLCGKSFKKKFIQNFKSKFLDLKSKLNRDIKIVTLNLTSDIASDKYNLSIKKAASEFEILCENISIQNPSYQEAKSFLENLNSNQNIDGILINQPLKENLNSIQYCINPEKDLESMHPQHLGHLFFPNLTTKVIPCTALAIMEIINDYQIPLEGLNVCLIGRSLIIGKPLFLLFLEKNATVTICHSKTKDLLSILKNADLIVSSIGKANFINDSMIKNNAILIDVGTNYIDNKLYGDIDFESVSNKASYISPVPGGIGLITPLMLFKNLELLIQKKYSLKNS